jgi:hypothetical protein
VFQVKEETEDQLIAQDCLPRDDEGEWEFDSVIKSKSINSCRSCSKQGIGTLDQKVGLPSMDFLSSFSFSFLCSSCA